MSIKKIIVDDLTSSPIIFPKDSGISRERARPIEYRQPTYDLDYDFHTLFYDVFLSDNSREIMITAPPFLKLRTYISGTYLKLFDGIEHYDVEVEIINFQRYDEAIIKIPENVPPENLSLKLILPDQPAITVQVRDNYHEAFAGKNVAMTIYKFDHLDWVKDWVEFHVKYHGTNAFVFYRNNAVYVSRYALLEAVQDIPGIDVVAVVDWPFPFGPRAGGTEYWDSDFAKHGALGHARRRFLEQADAVLNVDIDELLVLEDHRSIFTKLAATETGYVTFNGIWTSAPNDRFEDLAKRRHTHYQYHGQIYSDTKQCPIKWVVDPKKCSQKAQWTTHEVKNMEGYSYPNDQVRYRHFRNLNMGWKVDRTKPLLAYNKDRLLIEAYEKIGWI
jgi:hypothetical protein